MRPPRYEEKNPGEDFTEYLAQELVREKFIERYIRAKKCGFLDGEGIDFVFYRKEKNKGKIIVLQITMTKEKVQIHKKRHPKIPVMVVERDCNLTAKKQELKNIIEQFTPAIEKVVDKIVLIHIDELLDLDE